MIEPKPLSKELREIIAERAPQAPLERRMMYEDLLAAEQFWREAVRDAGLFTSDVCPFNGCHESRNELGQFDHKSECPWRLSQE